VPRAPKHCGFLNCPNKVTGRTYCDEHTTYGWSNERKAHYGTEHQQWRKQVMARDKGICQIRGPRCTHRATEADHIDRHGARYDITNGQAACSQCHADKTAKESAESKQDPKGVGGA